MNSRLKIAGLTLASMFSSSQVSGAPPEKETAQTRKLMFDYAQCVVKSHRDRASEAIVSNAGNSIILRQYPQLISSECLVRTGGEVQLTFGGDIYRHALADALVNNTFVTRGVSGFADRLPLAHLPYPVRAELDAALAVTKSKRKRSQLQEGFDKQWAVGWLSRYGECVVRQEPEKSRFWILTPPETPEETSRINDLRSTFAACMPEGTVKFSKVTMRGTVAINYYRLAMATARPGTEPSP